MKKRILILLCALTLLILLLVVYLNLKTQEYKRRFSDENSLYIFEHLKELGFSDLDTITIDNEFNDYFIDASKTGDYKQYIASNIDLIKQKLESGSIIVSNQLNQDIAGEFNFPFETKDNYNFKNTTECNTGEFLLRLYYFQDMRPVIHDVYLVSNEDYTINQTELFKQIDDIISKDHLRFISNPNKNIKAKDHFFDNTLGHYKTTLIDGKMNFEENIISLFKYRNGINEIFYSAECILFSNPSFDNEEEKSWFISYSDNLEITIDTDSTCLDRYDYFPTSVSSDTLNIMVGSDTKITKWSFSEKGKSNQLFEKISPYLIYKCNDYLQTKNIVIEINYNKSETLINEQMFSFQRAFVIH